MAPIYLRDRDRLVPLVKQPYEAEEVLQGLIAQHPELISGEIADDEASFLLIRREAGVPADRDGNDVWSIDHLFVDRSGIPTIVEVKRGSDSRIRREVIGQMLDYAANAAAYYGAERIRAEFEAEREAAGDDPIEVVADFLGETEVDQFWDRVSSNLLAGALRLVFVADEIPTELQRVVEFLNEQMSPAEVIAIEVRQFVETDGSRQTLVPRILGRTAAAASRRRGRSEIRRWDEETLVADLTARLEPDEVAVATRLLEWIKGHEPALTPTFGKGKVTGSIAPALDTTNAYLIPFILYSSGWVEIPFVWMKRRRPFDQLERRAEFLNRLNAIEGVDLPESKLQKRPNFPIGALKDEHTFRSFIETIEWSIEQALTLSPE